MKKYGFMEWEMVFNIDFDKMPKVKKREKRQWIEYYNIPVSYDIETSSFRNEYNEAQSITYTHAFNIDGYNFLMRTWDEMEEFLQVVAIKAKLSSRRRLIIYVHNLSYEFQFMKRHFNFERVFANGGERDILTATTDTGIEFRCSYMLSGLNLSRTAMNLHEHKIAKMEGDLDYDLVRTPETPLSEEELTYILNDVVIIEYLIREKIKESGDITKIPLTNTGYVREYVREQTLNNEDTKTAKKYKSLMKELTLEQDEYMALRHAFQGGYTHANVEHSMKTVGDVTAFDLNSSYLGRMVAYQYPMSKGEKYEVTSKRDFFEQIDNYCTLFYVRFEGLVRKANEGYLSVSKAVSSSQVTINNGRVETAESFETWMTDIDFRMMMISYDIDDFKVGTMFRYRRGYLPTPFIEAVLKLYEDKTVLKGVEEKKVEYNKSKGMLNSTYGMAVMNVIQDEFMWDDIAKTSDRQVVNIAEKLDKSNRNWKRFLYYPWGVWITAYARFDLFNPVVKLGSDYVYCDTDSIYHLNAEKNAHIFEEESKRFTEELKKAAKHHGFNYSKVEPKDINGKTHTLGIWAFDGHYKRFKTLGAKRYMVENESGINITVSGVNKKVAVPYLIEKYGDGIFEAFDENLFIPEGKAGKKTHTYIDEPMEGTVVDYKGNHYYYEELSGINLEETSYSMSISNEYREMIEHIQNTVKPRPTI